MGSRLLGYQAWSGPMGSRRMGVLVASQMSVTVTYGLNNAQERGDTFIEPGTPVYEA